MNLYKTSLFSLSRPGAIYHEAAEREAAMFKLLNNSVPTAVFSLNAAQYKVKPALWNRIPVILGLQTWHAECTVWKNIYIVYKVQIDL